MGFDRSRREACPNHLGNVYYFPGLIHFYCRHVLRLPVKHERRDAGREMPHVSGSCAVDPDDQQLRYSCKRPFLDMAHVGSDCPSASSSGASRTPRVAHCVSGLLRSFTLPMVHRSLLQNFIEPFGGHASIFLVLKTFDTAHKHQQLFPHDANADRVAGWNDATRSALREALDYVRPQQVRLIHEEPIQINTECRINANLSIE